MQPFDVLDRRAVIHRHYLLEASAGTGKTFSIQHVIVRLLIESDGEKEPPRIQDLLVVTFTRAAVRDLKRRIRSTLEQALKSLQRGRWTGSSTDLLPDYLQEWIERGEAAIQTARKKLQQALFAFEQAQILTIHAFCARTLRQFALESDMGLHALSGEEPLPPSEIMEVIRNFLRTEVRPEEYSSSQLAILLAHDPDQRKLLKLMQSSHEFSSFPSFREVCQQVSLCMRTLRSTLSLTSEKMMEDFRAQAGAYRNHKGAESKAATLAAVARFVALWNRAEWDSEEVDVLIRDGIVWVHALDPALLKGTPPPASVLHYPDLTRQFAGLLHPLIEEARSFPTLLARLAGDCRKHLVRYQQEEEKFSPDDLLRKMHRALDNPLLLAQVQATYRAAIIDEFQDTDPLQWQIFRRLFMLERHLWKGYLYLVGDPKQSIYSFRQADIYTYLAAARTLGEAHCFSLTVNYRSGPRLVAALNALFSSDRLSHFIPLPKTSSVLPYQPVRASETNGQEGREAEREVLHFFMADGRSFKGIEEGERRVFFPFMAGEILRLREKKGWAYRQFAVLVRDHRQALRLAGYFDGLGIPTLNQKGMSLAESPALPALIDLMRAVLYPEGRSGMSSVAGGPLMGWTHEELRQPDAMPFIAAFVHRLRRRLFEGGFALFFHAILRAVCKPGGCTVEEQILAREGGLEFHRDLRQIADRVIDHQYVEWSGNEGIIPFLDRFQTWEENEDDRVKRFQDPAVDGVRIMTLHFSKGLEFDVVFALGLVNRTEWKENLIPAERGGQWSMHPVREESEEYQRHCEENDAEKMRQLYVALTRAKHRLYVPVALHLPSKHLKPGDASPIDLLLARLNQTEVTSHHALYERLKQGVGKNLLDFLEKEGSRYGMSYSVHEELLPPTRPGRDASSSLPLQAPVICSVSRARWWLTSFSLLSQKRDQRVAERLALTSSPPRDFDTPIKRIHTLPANRETGLFVHRLLEKLPFWEWKQWESAEQALPLLRPFVQSSPFREWEQVMADLMFNALKTPLPPIAADFCLAKLEPLQIYREMPFLFPYQGGGCIEELEGKNGLIQGVVDLLFSWNEGYYMVDWKNNWLGDSPEAYAPHALAKAMYEYGYFMQATIYVEAIKRYLRLVDPRPFEDCFKGVLYLFLRGMQSGGGTGIYHFFPTSLFSQQSGD